MPLKELLNIKEQMEQLLEEMRNTHTSYLRLEILERFKKLLLLLQKGT